jgi:hypothetical protein
LRHVHGVKPRVGARLLGVDLEGSGTS